jgi:RNA polymerase sigma-70 factor (ECF subfamily)
MPIVYAHLRKLAGSYFRGRNSLQTLQPTALVHEVFLRLQREQPGKWKDRDHFIAVAATAMRQILVDHARKRHALKRGGGARVTLDTDVLGPQAGEARAVDVLAVAAALEQLAELSPRQARIVELQFFGGLTVEEVGRVLGVSTSLVEKEWRRARAWMQRALAHDPA